MGMVRIHYPMTDQEIVALQTRVGTFPDGFWGPESIAACQEHLRSMMPCYNPWPKSDQASLTSFYGMAGDESQLVSIEFPYPMFYERKPVKKTVVHHKCAASLLKVLEDIRDRYGSVRRIMEQAEDYAGVYNNRPMRGGSSPSLHARGAAIDLSPNDNWNDVSWPVVATMPIEIMECFARQGWKSAGAFWGRDAMHHQATQ